MGQNKKQCLQLAEELFISDLMIRRTPLCLSSINACSLLRRGCGAVAAEQRLEKFFFKSATTTTAAAVSRAVTCAVACISAYSATCPLAACC